MTTNSASIGTTSSIFRKALLWLIPRSTTGWIVWGLLIISLGAVYLAIGTASSPATKYRTAGIERRNLELEISATGTVEPEEVIDVGAQVAGLILSFGKDRSGKPIDYGSVVDEGMVLANIDQALYQSDVEQAQAQVSRAKADVLQLKAKFVQAELDWKRAQTLGPSDALSQSAFAGYRASFEAARAAVAVGEAAITQAEATLFRANRNLGYCVIKSPVNGVIIDKRVNVGQTVVSSLNAPSLFLIAKDLTRMQVWVSVNEADVGKIAVGQKVTFVVDAFPGEDFVGTVGKVRLNASMSQNVVTYIVEVNTDNASGRLLPYLTANARFEVAKRENVLAVPSGALRWAPASEQSAGKKGSTPGEGTVWVLPSNAREPRAVAVKVGLSDGALTEIESGEILEGDSVVVGLEVAAGASAQSKTNPFAPQIPRGARRG